MNKKSFAVTLAALLTGSAVCLGGCGNSADNSGAAAENEAAVESQTEAVVLTHEQQLDIIAENKDVWYVEPNSEWLVYAGVTDFDDNGRLEITVSREQTGTYVVSQFFMYEVNEDGSGITKINVNLDGEVQMPDISLNSVVDCYKSGDGKYFYSMTDCDMTDYTTYEYSNYLMKLENGELDFYKYSKMISHYESDGSINEKYYDASDNSIDVQEYTSMKDTAVQTIAGDDCEVLHQILGFHYYDAEADFSELLKLSDEKAARYNNEEYEEYTTALYSGGQSVNLGLDEIGSLYYSDIDEEYLKNRFWNSFYVLNFETGVESDYVNDGGEGSRFKKEIIFFSNDGTGYYTNPDGERYDFTWSVTAGGSGEVIIDGDTYRNSVFGYKLVDNDGAEHRAIAFEYRNEYIYAMCD